MQKQPTKAQKRRQHQADRDAEREAELEAERAQQGESEQAVEDKQLREMLTPLGLTIRAIQVSCFILKYFLLESLQALVKPSESNCSWAYACTASKDSA